MAEAKGQSSSPILASCLRRQNAGKTFSAWRELGSPDMTAALLQQRQQSMLTDQRTEYHQKACMPDVDWTLQSPCTLCLQVNRDLSEERSVISSFVNAGLRCQPDVKRWHDNSILLDSMLCQTSMGETGCCYISAKCMYAAQAVKVYSVNHAYRKQVKPQWLCHAAAWTFFRHCSKVNMLVTFILQSI